MEQVRIGFIGDSITHGTRDETLLGWPIRVGQAAVSDGWDITVYNLGVRADTSALVRPRWEAECAARLKPPFRCATVFAVGINDAAYETTPEHTGQRVPLEQSAETIAAMIAAAKRFGHSIWIGPTPVVEAMMPLRLTDTVQYDFRNAEIARYSAAYAIRAAALGVPYLDLYSALHNDPAYTASLRATDGLHPNAAGYAILADRIAAWDGWRMLVNGTL